MEQTHNVLFSPDASADLDHIYDYVAEDSEAAAAQLLECIIQRADSLCIFPGRGKQVEDILFPARIRYIAEGKYLIFYSIFDETVVILRIIHGARDYLPLLEDLTGFNEII